jgi:hypothetical protein
MSFKAACKSCGHIMVSCSERDPSYCPCGIFITGGPEPAVGPCTKEHPIRMDDIIVISYQEAPIEESSVKENSPSGTYIKPLEGVLLENAPINGVYPFTIEQTPVDGVYIVVIENKTVKQWRLLPYLKENPAGA